MTELQIQNAPKVGSLADSAEEVAKIETKKIESPFSTKKDEMIKLVESTNEVLRLFPQDPHFHPLLKHEKTMREGLACGLVMAFADVVTAVRSYTVDVSEDDIKEKLKALNYFKEYGFSIQPVQTCLNNLIMLRERLDELEGKKKSVMAELEEVEHEKDKDNSLLLGIEKNITALHDQRTFGILKIKKHDAEIVYLKSVARTVEDDIADAKRQLNAI